MHRRVLAALAFLAHSAPLIAQTNFPEVEPNSGKSQATIASPVAANDTLSGSTTGTVTTLGDPNVTTVDYFDVQLGTGAIGIYCYRKMRTTPTPGYTSSIRGVNQVGGVPGAVDVAVQTVSPATAPVNEDVWYGSCRGDRHYYRVEGTPATNGGYQDKIICTPITPGVVSGSFAPGPITVTTIGQGHATDTEIYLYDVNMDQVPNGHNDDSMSPASLQSRVTVTLAPGTYFVAVSDYNTCTNTSDAQPNEAFTNGNLLDFPFIIANSSTAANLNVSFSVSDGALTTPMSATKANAFNVAWFTFSVGSTSSSAFCLGDGTGTPCPCGNTGAAGHGCANSAFPQGGHLTSFGNASVSADTLVLSANNIPGPGLFFQANGTIGPFVFGDGLFCAAIGIIRLGVVFPTAGVAAYPGGLTPAPISIAGAPINPADIKHYQCWYRDSITFCTPSTFNLTQGLTLTWGP